MKKYAQLDGNNKVIGISFLSGEVESDNMIPLKDNEDYLGWTYNGGKWSEPQISNQPEPEKQKTLDDLFELVNEKINGKKIYAHKSDSTCQALINAMLLYKKNTSLIESIPNDLTQNEYATLSTLGMICARINSGASYSTAMSETKISNILYRAASCVKYWIDGYTPDDDCRVNFNQLTIELTACACYAKRVGMNLAWVNNFDV